MDPCTHSALYCFLQDQGGLIGGVIAGVFTLAGGGLAYCAGLIQAAKTKEAATLQVAAMRQQMVQELEIITDRDRRAARAWLSALQVEASRLKLSFEQSEISLQRRTGGYQGGATVHYDVMKSFLVDLDASVRAALNSDLEIDEQVRVKAAGMYVCADKSNTLIWVKGPFGDLSVPELKVTLLAASAEADGAMKAAEEALKNWR